MSLTSASCDTNNAVIITAEAAATCTSEGPGRVEHSNCNNFTNVSNSVSYFLVCSPMSMTSINAKEEAG